MNIIFFGSTSDSLLVLEKLSNVIVIITQPPKPVGRKHILTPTPVETWAKQKNIPVLSFPSSEANPSLFRDEQTVIDTLAPFQADLLVSASYGQKIPAKTITDAKYGGLNVHPSLLPRWRGADPVPWAILTGDHQTGVTVVTLSPEFDQGKIIAQKKVAIKESDTTDPLRAKLFEIGAKLLIDVLPECVQGKTSGVTQRKEATPYARRLTKQDGFEPWESIIDPKEAVRIHRKFRAFAPWPGLWTEVVKKRLKILSCHLSTIAELVLDEVQLEGKTPVSFTQFQKAYLST